MCTVTFFPTPGQAESPDTARQGFRMLASRDELHQRPAALPPEIQTHGPRRAAYPLDPSGGGTWVAVNDAGLTATLLNYNLPEPPAKSPGLRSRGQLIPAVLHLDNATEAMQCLESQVTPGQQLPFRLVLADREAVCVMRCDMQAYTVEHLGGPGARPWFTSSGLGDHRVQPPRAALYDQMLAGLSDEAAYHAQAAFHEHRWDHQPELSVNMHRADARTVSLTTVVVGDTVSLTYHPAGPTDPAADVEVVL